MDDARAHRGAGRAMAPESVQLAYQICVQGRADLALAPDEATGFSMTLLRLLAFEPGARRVRRDAVIARCAPRLPPPAAPTPSAVPPRDVRCAGKPCAAVAAPPAEARATVTLPTDVAEWPAFVASLKLPPSRRSWLRKPSSSRSTGNVLTLALPAAHKHLADKAYSDKLKVALDAGDGPQAAAGVRGRRGRGELARGAGKARARRAAGESRSRVSRRAVRARRARALRRQNSPRLDQTATRVASVRSTPP